MPIPTQNSCLAAITDSYVRAGNRIISVSGNVPNFIITMITPAGVIVNQSVTVLTGACIQTSPNGVSIL